MNIAQPFLHRRQIRKNWKDINLDNIDHYKLIHSSITKDLVISELYQIIDSNTNNQIKLKPTNQINANNKTSYSNATTSNDNNKNNMAQMRTDILVPTDAISMAEEQLLDQGLNEEDFTNAPSQINEIDEEKNIVLEQSQIEPPLQPKVPSDIALSALNNPYVDNALITAINNELLYNKPANFNTNNKPSTPDYASLPTTEEYSFDDEAETTPKPPAKRARKPKPPQILKDHLQ